MTTTINMTLPSEKVCIIGRSRSNSHMDGCAFDKIRLRRKKTCLKFPYVLVVGFEVRFISAPQPPNTKTCGLELKRAP